MASSSENKLNNLNTAKTKLNLKGNKKSEVNSKIIDIRNALEDFIQNDNLDLYDATENLLTEVENHSNLTSAVSYLNKAISNTKAQIAAEEAAAKKAAEEAAAKKAAAAKESAKNASSDKSTSLIDKIIKSFK